MLSFSLFRLAMPALVVVISLLASACDLLTPNPVEYQPTPWFKDGKITGLVSNTSAKDLDINNFLYSGMLDMYYWSDRVPKTLNPASFPLPDSLLAKTIVRPDDRFSYILKNGQAELDRLFSGTTPTPIFGFSSSYFNSSNVRIARVIAPSPAYLAGLRRGMRIISIDGKPIPSTLDDYNRLLNALGSTAALEVEDTARTVRTITIMRGVFDARAVTATNIFNVAGKNVGYLMLNSYTGKITDELNTAFATFARENVSEFVLDLRYNGGGLVSAAGHLCGLLAGQLAGTTYVELRYNPQYASNSVQYSMPALAHALRLKRIFVIINGGTASASELTINALKPFLDIVLIGSRSLGKAVGSNIVYHEKSDYLAQPISFKFVNARGEADFLNGFEPNRAVTDNVDRDFGDPQEICLRQALLYIQNGSFPTLTTKEFSSSTLQENTYEYYCPEHGLRDIIPAIAPVEKAPHAIKK